MPVLWVEAMEAGAVTRVSVSRHAVMRTCLGSGGPNQVVTGRIPPEMAPTPSGRTNDDGAHSGQLLQDHPRAGGSPDRLPGLRAHRGQGGEIDVKAGDPVYDAQDNQAKDVHGAA